jgi:cytochrome c oxidase subunit I+III
MPGPSWPTILAAFGTAAFFLLLTVKLVVPAIAFGLFAVAMVIMWLWTTDPGRNHPDVDIGGGIRLPVYVTGPSSHSWWATIVLVLVAGSTFACLVFSYFFLWTVSPDVWPAATGQTILHWSWPVASAVSLGASSLLIAYASRALDANAHWRVRAALCASVILLAGGLGIEILGEWETGLAPTESGYAAVVYAFAAWQGLFVATLTVMAFYTIARSIAGMLDRVRRATFDNTMVLWHYAVAQGLASLGVIHLAGRLL